MSNRRKKPSDITDLGSYVARMPVTARKKIFSDLVKAATAPDASKSLQTAVAQSIQMTSNRQAEAEERERKRLDPSDTTAGIVLHLNVKRGAVDSTEIELTEARALIAALQNDDEQACRLIKEADQKREELRISAERRDEAATLKAEKERLEKVAPRTDYPNPDRYEFDPNSFNQPNADLPPSVRNNPALIEEIRWKERMSQRARQNGTSRHDDE